MVMKNSVLKNVLILENRYRTNTKQERNNYLYLLVFLEVGVSVLNKKAIPLQTLWFQEVEAPRFLDNRHIKVARLSALRTGRLHPPGNIPGTHFC
jgi:hypothetical protein